MAYVDLHTFATKAGEAAERRRKADERSTVWAFIWTLFAFKIATAAVIFWAAGGSKEAGILLTVTTWYYLAIPVVAVSSPLLFYLRLRRVRARRERLRRAEWMMD
jgi:hypothetical protein